jgi:glutamate racemase
MLKVVIFDSGYGGELFADLLEEVIPVVEVIRVIDWRNADEILSSAKAARKTAEIALKPYIGKVDLIVFANYLLSATSLKYFNHKYKNQKFIGLSFKKPDTFIKKDLVILTTKAVARTLAYRKFVFQLNRKVKTVALDAWPAMIDDGELSDQEIHMTIDKSIADGHIKPEEMILACSQFNDIKSEIKKGFDRKFRIYDGFNDAIREICKILKIRGTLSKLKG